MKNIPSVSTGDCLKQLETIYGKMIENHLPFGHILAPFLWGSPGIGKSSIVYSLGSYIEDKYHKKVAILDLRLYEYNPIDLKGIPYADEKNEYTKWLLPQILNFNDNEDIVNILFLDELLAARESVQAVGLQIVLDRKVDQYKIPDNTIIIAASNRKEDRSFSTNMSMALANRFAHYEIVSDVNQWKQYAYDQSIDPRIIAFISFKPSYLVEDVKDAGYAYCSPRSWEKVSNLIGMFEQLEEIQISIASYLGEGVATEFVAYCREYEELSTFEDIILGKGIVPESLDSLYAMISLVAGNIRHQDLTDQQLDHALGYISQFPLDYILAFMADNHTYFEQYSLRYNSLTSYRLLQQKVGRFI